jgi:hypothetical protein
LTSVAGGVLGYLIGYFALDMVEPWIVSAGYWDGYLEARDLVPDVGILGGARGRLFADSLQAVHHRRRRTGDVSAGVRAGLAWWAAGGASFSSPD